jgi:hypothetical protein
MISPSEIEAFTVQIAEPGFETARIEALIGHLAEAEFKAVMHRAAAIARAYGKAAFAEADALENLSRLAHAAGMPDGGNPFQWLQERDLVEEVDGGYRFKTAKPEVT